MGVKKEFSKDVLIYGFGNGIKKIIGFVLLPFYTRALTPGDYGLLNTLTIFVTIGVAILDFGLTSASGFYFFKAKEEGKDILFTHFVLKILTFIPSVILSFFSEFISIKLFGTNDFTWIVFVTSMIIPASLLLNEQELIYRYYRNAWKYNLITILYTLLRLGAGILLVVLLKYGVLGAQLATLIAIIIIVLISIISFTRNKYSYKFSWYWAKKMLKFGFPLIWAALAMWVYNGADRLFLLYYKDLTEIGYYSVGSTFSQTIQLFNAAVQMSFPVLFFSYLNDDTKDYNKTKHFATESYNIYIFVAVSIAIVISVFSLELVYYITTPEYLLGALSIPLLLFSRIAAQSFQTMGPGIEVSQKTWHYTWLTIVTALLNISLNFYFIPKFGFVGAAFTTLVSFLVLWCMKYFVSQKYFKIKYRFTFILIYFMIGLSISIIIPFSNFYFNYEINTIIKIAFIFVGLIVPFLLKIVKRKEIVSLYYNLIHK